MPKKLLSKILTTISLFILFVFSSKTVLAANPSLTISPSTGSFYANQTFYVDVLLNTQGANHLETYLELNFDNTLLQVVDITEKNIYWQYLDQDLGNSTGKLTLRGNNHGSTTTATGTFVRIIFKALSAGTANLTFGTNTYIYDSSSVIFSPLDLVSSTITLSAPQANSLLNLTSVYDTWSVNDSQTVSVSVDTQGNDIAGVDIILHYDPARFEYQSMQWTGLLPNQNGFNVDSGTGVITISGNANPGTPLNTVGNIATFTFKALTVGTSPFYFDWTNGSTTDTNIVSYTNPNTDLLSIAPLSKNITVSSGAFLDFTFNLLSFLGVNRTRDGSITVSGPNVTTTFSTNVNLGSASVAGHSLGTFTYGNTYDLIIKVPGYLKEKQSLLVNVGSNGPINFGNLRPGDTNNDGVANTVDLWELYNNWNRTDFPIYDLNADGKVNTFDVGLLYGQFNNIDNV